MDENFQVVGVNYGGATNEDGELVPPFYAISSREAQGIVDRLRKGVDVESLGVNAMAVPEEKGIAGGIFVFSVKTGSPADKVGLENAIPNDAGDDYKAFDFITELEGTALAKDGTMEVYCKILRQRSPGDPLQIEVLRLEENGDIVTLEGTVNGEPLREVKREKA